MRHLEEVGRLDKQNKYVSRQVGNILFATALMLLILPSSGFAAKSLKKIAQGRLSTIIEMGLQSGIPAVRSAAVNLCIRKGSKKEQKRCAKDGAVDPCIDVRVSTCRALYLAKKNRDAGAVLFELFADVKIPYRDQLERIFDLPSGVANKARGDLLGVLSNAKLENREERAKEVAYASGVFERKVLFEGALGKKEPTRGIFRGVISSLDHNLDHEVIEKLFAKGDSEIRSLILESYEATPVGRDLPKFLWAKQIRGASADLSHRIGVLLSNHGKKAALPYLKTALKGAATPEDQIEIMMAMVPVATKDTASAVRSFTNKDVHETKEVRWAAWAVLMRARDGDALSRIDRWLKADIEFKRKMATRALPAKMGEKALHELRRLLADGLASVRVEAAKAMGELGRPDSVTDLVYALNSQQDREERYVIAQALFKAVPTAKMPDVSYVLQDQDPRIRRLAVDAFIRARDTEFEPYLRPLLVDRDKSMRTAALEGMLLMDVNVGMTAFVRAMNWLEGSELQVWVLRHKSMMAPYVKKALTSSRENVRRSALIALDHLPEAAQVDVAAAWVEKTSSPVVRIRLSELLAGVSFRRIEAGLERFAKSTDIATRAAAIRLLASHGKASDLIAAALEDTAIEVQLAAVQGILVKKR